MRSPILLPIRMNAAETKASKAIADWTPLAVVCRSRTTAEIDTFISDVSTTSTNIAIASRIASRRVAPCVPGASVLVVAVTDDPAGHSLQAWARGTGRCGGARLRVLQRLRDHEDIHNRRDKYSDSAPRRQYPVPAQRRPHLKWMNRRPPTERVGPSGERRMDRLG